MSIHITEIERILRERGADDAKYVVEIHFDKPGGRSGTVHEEFRNRGLIADCPFGSILIAFDDEGSLEFIEMS